MSNLPVPIPRTFTTGETETAAFYNAMRDALNFLLNPPVCNATQATAQTLATATWTALTLDATVEDSYGGHSNSTNNSRYTAQVAGWYMAFAAACFSSNATGWRGIRLEKNGAVFAGAATEVGTNPSGVCTIASPSAIVFLNAGDYLEAYGFQNSGGNLATSVNTDADCSLTVVWVHT